MGQHTGTDPLMAGRVARLILPVGLACSSPADKPQYILPADSGVSPADTAVPEPEPQPTETGSPEPDTGMPTVEIDPPAPSLDAASVATSIAAALSLGIPEPLTARRAYIDALAHRDAFCPGGGDLSIIGEWAGCTAESGWQFAGYTEYTGSTSPEAVDDFHLLADFRFLDPAGHRFVGGGELDLVLSTDGGDRSWTSQVSGTFSYAEAPGWMSPEGASATLQTTGSWAGSTWALSLDGAATDGVHALHLQAVTASNETCDSQASGVISLRDTSGYWHTLSLDCGCGEVRYANTTDLGEACVDISAVLADLALGMRP